MLKLLFGGSSDKGIVSQAADAIERFAPGEVKQAEMAIDAIKAGDESQKNAQQLVLPTHNDLWNSFIDGLNRLVRPLFSYWILLLLLGFAPQIPTLNAFEQNLVWTIVGFWFGTRMLFKDLPSAIKEWRKD